jgi:hypothetical protein
VCDLSELLVRQSRTRRPEDDDERPEDDDERPEDDDERPTTAASLPSVMLQGAAKRRKRTADDNLQSRG